MQWRLPKSKKTWTFHVIASALLGEILLEEKPQLAEHRFIVLPGGRAPLILYKLDQDDRLAQQAANWHFLKFRMVRRLDQSKNLTPEQFLSYLEHDPLSQESTQLPLF